MRPQKRLYRVTARRRPANAKPTDPDLEIEWYIAAKSPGQAEEMIRLDVQGVYAIRAEKAQYLIL